MYHYFVTNLDNNVCLRFYINQTFIYDICHFLMQPICIEIEQIQGFTTKKTRFSVILISLISTTHWSYFPSLSEEAIQPCFRVIQTYFTNTYDILTYPCFKRLILFPDKTVRLCCKTKIRVVISFDMLFRFIVLFSCIVLCRLLFWMLPLFLLPLYSLCFSDLRLFDTPLLSSNVSYFTLVIFFFRIMNFYCLF